MYGVSANATNTSKARSSQPLVTFLEKSALFAE